MAGSHEVRGSIPLGSTIETSDQDIVPGLFIFCSNGVRGGSSSLDFLRTGVLFTLLVGRGLEPLNTDHVKIRVGVLPRPQSVVFQNLQT